MLVQLLRCGVWTQRPLIINRRLRPIIPVKVLKRSPLTGRIIFYNRMIYFLVTFYGVHFTICLNPCEDSRIIRGKLVLYYYHGSLGHTGGPSRWRVHSAAVVVLDFMQFYETSYQLIHQKWIAIYRKIEIFVTCCTWICQYYLFPRLQCLCNWLLVDHVKKN